LKVFWRVLTDGVTVAVKVQPKSRRPGVHGETPSGDGERLRIAVSEPPEGGRANRAACASLAAALGVSASTISIVSGAGSREKTLRVSGDPARLAASLAAL